METVKINRKNAVYSLDVIDIKAMMEVDGRLLVVLKNDILNKIGVGESVFFRRNIYCQNEEIYSLSEDVTVLEKTTYKYEGRTYSAMYTTIPVERKLSAAVNYNTRLHFKTDSANCITAYDCYFDEVHRYLVVYDGKDFVINDWLYYYDDEQAFIIEFDRNHDIFQQDIYSAERNGGYSISVQTAGGSRIGTIEGISIPFTGLPTTVEMEDTLTTWEEETCGKFDSNGKTYKVTHHKYTHTPSDFSKNRIKFTSVTTSQVSGDFYEKATYLISNGTWFVPKFNPYYYFYFKGVSEKTCSLWHDEWWDYFDSKNGVYPIREIWENSGNTTSFLGVESAFWNVPMISFSDEQMSALGSEEEQNGRYVDEIIDATVPEFIDMEKIKYIPVIMDNAGGFDIATAITFDFHFRKREVSSMAGGYPHYNERWNISEESGMTTWWNGMEYYGNDFNGNAFSDFYNASGETSDLLGYLNFVDDDVYYRKSRLSMSFIRISFYSSKDPIEQKLLYYSTSFLDATSLYGKFMKQYIMKTEEGEDDGQPIVFYDNNTVSARLDTEIVIKNEYQTEKSSEGFNLYLFADDAEGANADRTIYMKVEFNHAGNGKTIPMIMWPRNGSGFRPLYTSNFLEDLYIPVKVGYINGKYVYSIPGAKNKDNNIKLVLFEPKLDYYDASDAVEADRDISYIPPREAEEEAYEETQGVDGGNAGYDSEDHSYLIPEYNNSQTAGGGGSSVIPSGENSGTGDITPKGNKRLKFWAYKVNTLYGKRISLPFYITYTGTKPSDAVSLMKTLKIESTNPSVIKIDKNNFTNNWTFYNTCDSHTYPLIAHIGVKDFKGFGSTEIKVSFIDGSVSDTCVVNVTSNNLQGANVSEFGYKNLVYPYEIFVGKNSYFDVWCHSEQYKLKEDIVISDPSAISLIEYSTYPPGGGNVEFHGYRITDGRPDDGTQTTAQLFKTNNKTGTYQISFTHQNGKYAGTYRTIVHIIDD